MSVGTERDPVAGVRAHASRPARSADDIEPVNIGEDVARTRAAAGVASGHTPCRETFFMRRSALLGVATVFVAAPGVTTRCC